MSSSTAENYQLKWHSHLSNLNSSVSTLYRNEKFADVMLFTSNAEGGHPGIPAHKMILSSCSHYFANIFENNVPVTTSLMYIILPPELSRRSAQILIQYMYSGEATVSNDILNEVLRGGEILKIRGLCRNNQNIDNPPSVAPSHQSQSEKSIEITTHKPDVNNSDKYYSEPNEILKESPVIVMSSQQQPQHIPQSLVVKKDVAIDPNENMPSTHYGLVSLQIAAAVKKSHFNDKRLKHLNESDKLLKHGERVLEEHHDRAVMRDRNLRDSMDGRLSSTASESGVLCHTNKFDDKAHDMHIPEALNFLTIKQEPVEWMEYDHNGIEKSSHIDVQVKPELLYADDDDESLDMKDPIYSPLTCELCSETFTVPAEWVRHIEGHAEATQNIPKKRRRLDDNNTDSNIAALRCDLCTMFFVTPAEWVRHVQNTHTETELAISNNSSIPKRTIRTQRPIDGQPLEKSCSICNKTFPSYASMVIHKRTHTGERPFYCSLCNKGFNVKSNLLRHMRTLHNQLLNPSNYSDGPENFNE